MLFKPLLSVISLLTVISLMVVILRRRPRSPVDRVYLYYSAWVALITAYSLLYYTGIVTKQNVALIVKVNAYLIFSVGAYYLSFAYVYLKKKFDRPYRINIAVTNAALVLMLASDLVFTSDVRQGFASLTNVHGPLYPYYLILFFIVPFAWSLILFAKKLRSATLPVERQPLLLFLAGTGISIALMIMRFLFREYFFWTDSAVPAIQTAFTFIAIKKYQVFQIRPEDLSVNLMQILPEGVLIVNQQGRVVESNPMAARLLGVDCRRLLGTLVADILPGYLDSQDRYERDVTVDRIAPARLHYVTSPVREGGVHIGTIIAISDVSERMRWEEKMVRLERRWHDFIDFLPLDVYEGDGDGRLTFINKRGLMHFGFTEEDLAKGIFVTQVVSPVDRERQLKNIAARNIKGRRGEASGSAGDVTPVDDTSQTGSNAAGSPGKEIYRDEYTMMRSDGSTFPAIVYSTPIVGEGHPAVMRGVLIDVTDQKRWENQLRRLEQRWRDFIDFLPLSVYERDGSGRLTFINKRGLTDFGFTQDEFEKGISATQVVSPADRDVLRQNIAGRKMDGKETYRDEYTMVRADGSTFPGIVYSTPINNEGGTAVMRGVVVNVTELRVAQEQLEHKTHELDKRLRELNCIYNIFSRVQTGGGSKEAISQGIVDYIPPAFQKPETTAARMVIMAHHEFVSGAYDPAWPRIVEEITAQGQPFAVLEVYSEQKGTIDPFLPEERRMLRAIADTLSRFQDTFKYRQQLQESRDKLEEEVRKRTAQLAATVEQLQQSEERYRELIENQGEGIGIVDLQGKFVFSNPAGDRIFGTEAGSLLGRNLTEYLTPEQIELIRNESKKRQGGEQSQYDLEISRSDGETRVVSITATPRYNQNGTVIGTFCIYRDVTDQRRAEQLAKQQQEQLVQSDKMATLGFLASGVAHEINNPNNFILLNSNNLTDIWRDLKPVLDRYVDEQGDFPVAGLAFTEIGNEIDQLIRSISDGAGRIKTIVQNLKDFARKDTGAIDQDVDVNATIAAAVNIMSNLIKKTTDCFETHYDKAVPHLRANQQQIEQVVINLLTNACQALTNRSQSITVRTQYHRDAQRVEIMVEDTGCGITEENLRYIFDPFFTTKRSLGGTGLGLSISYSIIKNHGGDIRFDSTVSRGTKAIITLPAPSAIKGAPADGHNESH